MNNNEAILLTDIRKSFKIYRDKGNTFRDRFVTRGRGAHTRHQVLKGINLSVARGEAVGLIGENGCGKSTALKLISRIMYPDRGSVQVSGRVSSLLELGAGFHPELSGRENIYTNASIFGLGRRETDRRLNSIIDFSELWDFIDAPVRTYSSGMYMRLAFSVAINVDADILLIDEILAVGDHNFQQKCYNRLKELKQQGVTIIIVTHDTSAVEDFCSRAVWINDGVIAADGPPAHVTNTYLEFMLDKQLQMDKRREEEMHKAEMARKDFTRDDIIDLYQRLLNRPPENDMVILSYLQNFDRLKDAEKTVKSSPEYQTLILAERQRRHEERTVTLTRDQIVDTYRRHLGRDPENEYVIEACRKAYGSVEELAEVLTSHPHSALSAGNREPAADSGKAAEVTGIRLVGTGDGNGSSARYGQSAAVELDYRIDDPRGEYGFTVECFTQDGTLCLTLRADAAAASRTPLPSQGTLRCRLPRLPLSAGRYKLYGALHDAHGRLLDSARSTAEVSMAADTSEAAVEYSWEVEAR